MAHYAKIVDGLVEQVIVASSDVLSSSETWVQTSYNTHGGIHSDGSESLRKNFAGIGYTYDSTRDAFIPPQQYPSWTLNEDTCQWEPPTPMPEEGQYMWDEKTITWKEFNNI
jgi:hypothetical protein